MFFGFRSMGIAKYSKGCYNHIDNMGLVITSGAVTAKKINVMGMFHVGGDLRADVLQLTGSISCKYCVEAQEIRLLLGDHATIRHLKGGDLHISISKEEGNLTAEQVEGRKVTAQHLTAKRLVADDVVLEDGCCVEEVRYRSSFQAADSCRIGTVTKVDLE